MTALKKGFTLIELLIVIAILGVLAVVVLVAINPAQQLARTRDAGRISAVAQIGHALVAYATTHNSAYPDEAATWAATLVTAGEISVVPGPIAYSVVGRTICGTNLATNSSLCYAGSAATAPTNVIVFARLESDSNNSLCGATAAWEVYDTVKGRAVKLSLTKFVRMFKISTRC